MLANVVTRYPGFQHVFARRQIFEPIISVRVGFLKVRTLENENRSAHPVVDLTVNRDGAWFAENDAGWFFLFSIPAEVETFRFRIGKYIVISVVHVGKLDRRTDQNRKQVRREGDIFLRHESAGFSGSVKLSTEITFEINDRRGRVDGRHRDFRASCVPLAERVFVGGLGQLNRAFDYVLAIGGSRGQSQCEQSDGGLARHYSAY